VVSIELSLFIAQITINDSDKYQQYIDGFYEVFDKYNGKVLSVDDNPRVIEGKKIYSRIVVIRFPNEVEFERWYFSSEYQELAGLRWEGSEAYILLAKER
jgi:uncharacterized protein (DUF1330 family)